MEFNSNKFLIYILMFIILSGCQNVKDTLSMKKKKSYDEFLIEKKNPLVLPPDFSKLPKPKVAEDEKDIDQDIDLSEVIGNSSKESLPDNTSSALEKSISEILKKK